MHHLLPHIERIDNAAPVGRKILLCPDLLFGRELLASFARRRGAWVGWEVATINSLANTLALKPLARSKRHIATACEIASVGEATINSARSELHPLLASIASDHGAREEMLKALDDLRHGGISDKQILEATGEYCASLARLMTHYSRILSERKLADSAWIVEQAVEIFDDEFPYVLGDAQIYVVPSWSVTGLSAKLLSKLIERGARVLPARSGGTATYNTHTAAQNYDAFYNESDEIVSCDSHTRFLRAATVTDELRAVLRDAAARGGRYEEIEIACTDPDKYGIAIEALCSRLSINVNTLRGIPLFATRLGRAINHWLDWLASGFNATVLCRALESNDFISEMHDGAEIARVIRHASIGWGRDATVRGIKRLEASVETGYDSTVDEDDNLERKMSLEKGAASMLTELLAAAPLVRDATNESDVTLSVAEIAKSVITVLALITVNNDSDKRTIEKVRSLMQDISLNMRSEATSAVAIGLVRKALGEVRAWTQVSDTLRPNRVTGGHLHVTTLQHAGLSGRKYRYVVGLDANSLATSSQISSLLPDSVRRQFPRSLRTSDEWRAIRAMQLDSAIVASDTSAVLSYAESADGSSSGISHQLLEAWRSVSGNHNATYADMRSTLGAPECAVPSLSATPIDARDVWLQLLQGSTSLSVLSDAKEAIRSCYPHVARGLDAASVRKSSRTPTPWHGIVQNVDALRIGNGSVISPAALEAFASCPLRWFYRYGVQISVPAEAEYDEGRWLDATRRGALLHEVYSRIVEERLHEQDVNDSANRAVTILNELANEYKEKLPPPSEAVFAAEAIELEADVKTFLAEENRSWFDEPWEQIVGELEFGNNTRVQLTLSEDMSVRMRGRVDRVDRAKNGLRVVDYKTGRPFSGWNDKKPLDGGRRLQLAVYAHAIQQLYNEPVTRVEYRFPTVVGGGEVFGANAEQLSGLSELVASIVQQINAGHFIPTYDAKDCAMCNYSQICKATPSRFGGVNSPRADWGKANKDIPEYEPMVKRRGTA